MQCELRQTTSLTCLRALRRDKGRIVREDLVQPVARDTVLKREAARERIEFRLALPAEVFRPLLHEQLGQ
jgi:hypothetical protein